MALHDEQTHRLGDTSRLVGEADDRVRYLETVVGELTGRVEALEAHTMRLERVTKVFAYGDSLTGLIDSLSQKGQR